MGSNCAEKDRLLVPREVQDWVIEATCNQNDGYVMAEYRDNLRRLRDYLIRLTAELDKKRN